MADLVARQQGCCPLLSFAINVSPGETTLDVSGLTDSGPLFETLAMPRAA